jgi:hypothetical protein
VLSAEGALAVTVDVQQEAHVLLKVPNGVDDDIDAEVCGVGVGYWNLEN